MAEIPSRSERQHTPEYNFDHAEEFKLTEDEGNIDTDMVSDESDTINKVRAIPIS
jgi:hypothetical protein